MPLPDGPHLELLRSAVAAEARGHRALLAGEAAAGAMREAATAYRASWALAPPESYGRLIGAVKAAVIAGDAGADAAYIRKEVPDAATSPPAAYARAVAALVEGDDAAAVAAAQQMRAGGAAFGRAAAAVEVLVARDAGAYAAAVRAIVVDFEHRDEHLTGVPIADTALMFECLAQARGLRAWPDSPLLPPRPAGA